MIRTGQSSPSSARVATGLVLRVGALDFIIDNALRFRAGAPLPHGVILPFGSHRVFVASVTDMYPREVHVFSGTSDPLPPSCCSAASDSSVQRSCAEVVMAGPPPVIIVLEVLLHVQQERLRLQPLLGPARSGTCLAHPWNVVPI